MKIFLASACLFLLASTLRADDAPSYVGHWSNGRGETLIVTEKTIQFGNDRPVAYRDVTDDAASDDASYELQITTPGEVNAFPGKTLGIVCEDEDDSMEITGYRSHADYVHGSAALQTTTWYRDDDEEEKNGPDDIRA
ncbi:MAG: hypothetical protein M3Y86_04440 [Verrucomicrobiota bacterium]|nr:hypothetical protein [Verrucomicrobiota bacterium]